MQAFPGARPALPWSMVVVGWIAAGWLMLATGCGRGPAPSQPDTPAEQAVAAEPPAPEPVTVEPEPVEAAATEPEAVEPEPAPTEPTPPADVAPPDPVAVENPPVVEEPQEIVVELDEAQRAELAAQAERDLALAVQVARDAQLRQLSAQEQETLATVEGLVAAARNALTAGDVQAAANLANKAKLLAAELAPK